VGYRVEKDVMVSMRDGVTLATDLFLPDGGPAPTLLVRMAYNKNVFERMMLALLPHTMSFVEAGYAVVWQDCRGTYGSNGAFRPHIDDASDGADTVEWIRQQSWCDGNVGSYGISYLGFVQWATASRQPEGLKAIAPTATTTDYYVAPWYSRGGALSWSTALGWVINTTIQFGSYALQQGKGDPEVVMKAAAMSADLDSHLGKLPIIDQPVLNEYSPWWKDWLEHPDRDGFWSEMAPAEHFHEMTTPALHVVGWFDFFVHETTRAFTRMHAEAATAEARQGQRLIIGPWDHLYQEGRYRDRNFGLIGHHVSADITGAHLRFFDRHLRGNAEADVGASPVRIFVMGIDEWRDEQNWPLPDTDYVDYYLDGSGRANTAGGDGVLATSPPTTERADTYRYDPMRPVPSLGGRVGGNFLFGAINETGPVDQSPVESRDDVLCFTSPVLEDPVEVTGNVSLVLHASTSALDTDFTGKLVDVFPDGRAIYLTDGILRARYRNSLAEPELLEPDRVYELTLDLGPTSNVFLPGHRIRLEVSSSNFPLYDRNTNTGGIIAYDTDQPVVAVNQVLHGPKHASRLVLPLIRRG
jgi:putative CocE/NonD family hydrolase